MRLSPLKHKCILFAILVGSTLSIQPVANNLQVHGTFLDNIHQPVIGIVTLPMSDELKESIGNQYEAYVPSSYKKWIE
jgi:hypothetical protein